MENDNERIFIKFKLLICIYYIYILLYIIMKKIYLY